MVTPFDPRQRDAILSESFELRARLLELTEAFDTGREEAGPELDSTQERISLLSSQYEQGVPLVRLSRCPFSGQEVVHSIDHLGLDGLWWDSESPVRPREDLPRSYFALTGAVKLDGQIEGFPFLCQPGPGAPFVIPRLLGHPQIKAVVSSLQVGRHQAFPIFYFAEPVPYDMERVNSWGTEDYLFLDPLGEYRWNSAGLTPADLDCDLERWIRAGKLLWITPGDAGLGLRSDVRRCPYISLEGGRALTYVSEGKVWTWDADESD